MVSNESVESRVSLMCRLYAVLPLSDSVLFYVPFHRKEKFFGRSDIMDQITQRLETTSGVAIAGKGGVG